MHQLHCQVHLEVSADCTHYSGTLTQLSLGLLATAIVKMDGVAGLAGWRWIFILEGIATVMIALISAVFLPADIQSAKFFTEEEREFACGSAPVGSMV